MTMLDQRSLHFEARPHLVATAIDSPQETQAAVRQKERKNRAPGELERGRGWILAYFGMALLAVIPITIAMLLLG